MAKILSALLAALFIVFAMAVPASAAPRGKFMYAGTKSPQQFSVDFQQYINRDPMGLSLIDAKKCDTEASCGTGVAFLEGILSGDPDASVNGTLLRSMPQEVALAEIPAFLRKLEARCPEPGEYWSDCMVRSDDRQRDPSGWKRLAHCALNQYKPGEKAYVDPDTGRTVMKQGCANTGVQQVKQASNCVDDVVYAEQGETVLLDQRGPTDLTQDACTGLKRAGETEFESPYIERCPSPYCSLAVADRSALHKEWAAGSFYVDQTGYFIVRHPAKVAEKDSEYQFFYCRHRGRVSACALGIDWYDYLPAGHPQELLGDKQAAFIFGSEPQLRQSTHAKTRIGTDSVLFWDYNRSDCPKY